MLGIGVNRAGIIPGIVVAMLWSYYARGGYIIARATEIFFGLCASAFLPAFWGRLFWKRMTRIATIWSMIAGFGDIDYRCRRDYVLLIRT